MNWSSIDTGFCRYDNVFKERQQTDYCADISKMFILNVLMSFLPVTGRSKEKPQELTLSFYSQKN